MNKILAYIRVFGYPTPISTIRAIAVDTDFAKVI